MNSNTEREIWLPVKGYEGSYEVSNLGRVRSLDRLNAVGRKITGRLLKFVKNKQGYFRVQIFKNGKESTRLVSRLVAEGFLTNVENKPCVNHIDGCRTNNAVENLEWATYAENTQHAVRTGLLPPNIGTKNGLAKLTPELVEKAKVMHKAGIGYRTIAKAVGVSRTGIRNAINGKSWKHLI